VSSALPERRSLFGGGESPNDSSFGESGPRIISIASQHQAADAGDRYSASLKNLGMVLIVSSVGLGTLSVWTILTVNGRINAMRNCLRTVACHLYPVYTIQVQLRDYSIIEIAGMIALTLSLALIWLGYRIFKPRVILEG